VNVDTILADILQREGWPAYTEDSRDRGGPTKGGITMRTLEAWRGRRCTRKELRTLGEDEALRILKRRYVEANGINRLDRLPIQGQLVDNAVLSGPYIAIQDLQKALGTVTVDGICGPENHPCLCGGGPQSPCATGGHSSVASRAACDQKP
jgi:lysozyme family protein